VQNGLAPVEDRAHLVVGSPGEAIEDFGVAIRGDGGESLAVVLGAAVGAEGEGAAGKDAVVRLPIAAGEKRQRRVPFLCTGVPLPRASFIAEPRRKMRSAPCV
jgi:hypothetical protein